MHLCYKNKTLIAPPQSAPGMKGDAEGKERRKVPLWRKEALSNGRTLGEE